METIQNFARQACSALANSPIACDQTAAAFQWWHFYLAALIGLIVAGAIAIWRTFIAPRSKEPELPNMSVSGGRTAERTLFLHPRTVARVLNHEVDGRIGQRPLAMRVRKNTENKDFFVRIYEVYEKGGKPQRKEVLHRVLKIVPVAYQLQEDQIQFDIKSLNEVRSRNISLDDDDDAPVDGCLGRYEVFVRPTSKTDIGYWLTHPNGDVRYPIWGALIAITVEYSSQIFGVANSLWRTFT